MRTSQLTMRGTHRPDVSLWPTPAVHREPERTTAIGASSRSIRSFLDIGLRLTPKRRTAASRAI